jgi:outer membrane protein OmpA-like peptidoglycan-associated protein
VNIRHQRVMLAGAVMALFAACATVPPGPPPDVVRLQNNLDRLHNDPRIASNAGVELANADAAVDVLSRNARTLPPREYQQGVYIADKLIGVAEASALARFAEERGNQLGMERERLLARSVAVAPTTTTTRTVVTETPGAPRTVVTETAAPPVAVVQTRDGEIVSQSRAELMAMQNQLPGVESRLDARGLVIRLGDYMFEPGRDALTPTAEQSLDSIARVLRSDTDAGIIVEGHGGQGIAADRANAVRDYLDARGVQSARIASRTVAYNGRAERDSRVDIVIQGDAR